jgi:hypothetical protein
MRIEKSKSFKCYLYEITKYMNVRSLLLRRLVVAPWGRLFKARLALTHVFLEA